MKIKSLVVVALLACTSCSNAGYPFRVEKFFPLGPNCDLSLVDTFLTSQGYLDVAAGAPQFFIGVQIGGAQNVTQQSVLVGVTQLEAENRNRPIILQQVVNYRLSKRVGPTPRPYITNRTIPFSVDGLIQAPIQLISPELSTALFEGLTPSNSLEDFVDIQVDVEFLGEFSATRNTFTTGTLTYPIRAFRSIPALVCPSPTNGYVKFPDLDPDPATTEPDFCSYVGQQYGQTTLPAPPSTCCTAAGPGGGAGC